jgi:hypothetical protein
MTELGRTVLGMPVRIGAPANRPPLTSLPRPLQSPTYATSVGLLLWGLREDARIGNRRSVAGQDNRRDKWVGKAWGMLRHLLPD